MVNLPGAPETAPPPRPWSQQWKKLLLVYRWWPRWGPGPEERQGNLNEVWTVVNKSVSISVR